MSELADSYSDCELIARRSGSNFYRSFAFLTRSRRNAMMALYAFARLADDAIDGQASLDDHAAWSSIDWHDWLDRLHEPLLSQSNSSATACLTPIRSALADSIKRFSIPMEPMHEIIRGVGMDATGTIRYEEWEQTKTYCHRVASSVGVACLSIWAKSIGEPPTPNAMQAALDCGIAFQLTNILRDVAEDARRDRIYLPTRELVRFGIDTDRWLGLKSHPSIFAINEIGDWRGLIRLQIERAKAHFELGWRVANAISPDGQRMFSLMWQTYRKLLETIEREPNAIWQQRVSVSKTQKLKLVGQHAFSPVFQSAFDCHKSKQKDEPTHANGVWPTNGPRVAIVGAGLAGINTALHLARHGCRVTVFESKQRMGGRVGSFTDPQSGQSVDYCQHVGMVCCKSLQQWIDDTDQRPYWTELSELHFVSSRGNSIQVRAWPLPAPIHLAGLLIGWPQLIWQDRLRVGYGLLKLLRLKIDESNSSLLAINWLRANAQNDRTIKRFWGTILVSALGEQVDRITLGATHKVLVDGFAADRRAFHLLVPNRSLSELFELCVAKSLSRWGVSTRLSRNVKKFERAENGRITLSIQGSDVEAESMDREPFDAVVCAVPWNKVTQLMPESLATAVAPACALQTSPITGIHTWWDRPWLRQPHAILIDRFCQWIFPAPQSEREPSGFHTPEHYYQIVISGSRDLPHGDSEAILKAVKTELAEIFPESAVATMLRGKVVTDPNAVFSVSIGHEAGRLACEVGESERIWLAGDWTATGWPATMEGSLRSGALAAQRLLAYFGRKADLKIGD